MATAHSPLIFVFGLLGNIISFMVYLAPVPTFWRIYKKKSTEGFQSLPYICAIFSAMLWIYYALLKTNSFLLITINSAGCVIETIYIAIFLTYASKQAKMATVKLLVFLNFLGFSSIILICNYLAKASIRVQVLGWICVAFAVVVFAAPLSIIRLVIKTKSVEFLPFPLSVSLTVSAILWFMYGLLQKDLYIVLPNVLGFIFGVAQMILYGIYRNHHKAEEKVDVEMKLPEMIACSPVKINTTGINAEIHPVCSLPVIDGNVTEVVAVDVENETNKNQLHVHGPSSCAVDEIKMAGSTASPATAAATIQIVNCVG